MSILNPIPHRYIMVYMKWFAVFMQVLGVICFLDFFTDLSDPHPWRSFLFLSAMLIIAFVLKRIANAELKRIKANQETAEK